MKIIGITGGVGAGKSALLSFIAENYNSRVLLADDIAHDVMAPGTDCYRKLTEIFKEDDVFLPAGGFDRPALAKVLFSKEEKREALNAVVHPAVKEVVKAQFSIEKEKNALDVLVLEAALLIEENYDALCDELWYIFTTEENRRRRLQENRGYSDAKIDAIFASQLSEETFRAHCAEVIDNNRAVEDAFLQIENALEKRGIFKTAQ